MSVVFCWISNNLVKQVPAGWALVFLQLLAWLTSVPSMLHIWYIRGDDVLHSMELNSVY